MISIMRKRLARDLRSAEPHVRQYYWAARRDGFTPLDAYRQALEVA